MTGGRTPPWRDAALAFTPGFVLVLIVAVLGMPAGLAPLDAGDLVTASATLGVPHATGFPLAVAAGTALSWLPVGTIALRVAVVSLVAAALSAGLVGLTTHQLTRRVGLGIGAGVGVAVAFASVVTLALHARVAEVYALQLLCLVGTLVAAVRLQTTGDLRWAALAGLAVGAGLANHALMRLWTPLLVTAVVLCAPVGRRGRALGVGAVMATITVLAYAYLMAAAQRPDGVHTWGSTSTPAALWAHINGAYIRQAFAAEMRPSAAVFTGNLATLGRQMLPLGAALALVPVGAWALGRRAWRALLLLALIALVEVAYSVVINPMGLRDWQNGQALATLLGALAGVGAAALCERVARAALRPELAHHAPATGGGLAGALLLPLVVVANPEPAQLGRDWSGEDLMAAQAAFAPPGSVTTLTGDTLIATSMYWQLVLDARPDAVLMGRHLFSFPAEGRRMLARAPFDALGPLATGPLPSQADGLSAFTHAVLQSSLGVRAVDWEVVALSRDLPDGVGLEHRWPLGRATLGDPSPAAECLPPARSLCNSLDAPFAAAARTQSGAAGLWYRRWLATQRSYRGARLFGAGDYPGASAEFERALQLVPEGVAAMNSLAAARARMGDLHTAITLSREALRRDPGSSVARRNLEQFEAALAGAAAGR